MPKPSDGVTVSAREFLAFFDDAAYWEGVHIEEPPEYCIDGKPIPDDLDAEALAAKAQTVTVIGGEMSEEARHESVEDFLRAWLKGQATRAVIVVVPKDVTDAQVLDAVKSLGATLEGVKNA